MIKISCSSRRVRFPFLHFLITDCLEQSSVLYSHLYTCKKATSVIGKTSGRSKTNIKYICAVHSPIPLNFVSSVITSLSDSFFRTLKFQIK